MYSRMYLSFLLLATLSFSPSIFAKSVTRVVDVGAGLCTITAVDTGVTEGSVDDRLYMIIYDTGIGKRCSEAVGKYFSEDISEIDLLVISHNDYDHFGGARNILDDFKVNEIWHTGYERDIKSYEIFMEGVVEEINSGAEFRSMLRNPVSPGEIKELPGGATLTLLFGDGQWSGEKISSEAERRNAISIVMKLSIGSSSILFTGDTIGRRLIDDDHACRDAEKFMVESVHPDVLNSDVMIAPHHGANNGSASCFINAVSPEYVIFPAGHKHKHPSQSAYDRYIRLGVDPANMFRTDKGDREGKLGENTFEWVEEGSTCNDGPGDDDVLVYLYESLRPMVGYFDDGGYEVCND